MLGAARNPAAVIRGGMDAGAEKLDAGIQAGAGYLGDLAGTVASRALETPMAAAASTLDERMRKGREEYETALEKTRQTAVALPGQMAKQYGKPLLAGGATMAGLWALMNSMKSRPQAVGGAAPRVNPMMDMQRQVFR